MTYRQWEIAVDALSDAQRKGLAYWQSLAGPDGIPRTTDFSLLGFPAKVMPLSHIVDVINGGAEFKYRFWGSGFRNHFGYDGTGMTFAELRPPQIIVPVRAANLRVVVERRSIAMMSEFERGPEHDVLGFQRIIRMPLQSEGGVIEQVVSIVEFLQDRYESQKIIAANQAVRF